MRQERSAGVAFAGGEMTEGIGRFSDLNNVIEGLTGAAAGNEPRSRAK